MIRDNEETNKRHANWMLSFSRNLTTGSTQFFPRFRNNRKTMKSVLTIFFFFVSIKQRLYWLICKSVNLILNTLPDCPSAFTLICCNGEKRKMFHCPEVNLKETRKKTNKITCLFVSILPRSISAAISNPVFSPHFPDNVW